MEKQLRAGVETGLPNQWPGLRREEFKSGYDRVLETVENLLSSHRRSINEVARNANLSGVGKRKLANELASRAKESAPTLRRTGAFAQELKAIRSQQEQFEQQLSPPNRYGFPIADGERVLMLLAMREIRDRYYQLSPVEAFRRLCDAAAADRKIELRAAWETPVFPLLTPENWELVHQTHMEHHCGETVATLTELRTARAAYEVALDAYESGIDRITEEVVGVVADEALPDAATPTGKAE